MVILVKINMVLMMPGSALGKYISPDELKIDDYLNKLTEVFEKMLKDDSIGPVRPLLSFKNRLQSWLQSTKEIAQRNDEPSKTNFQERNCETDTTKDVDNMPKTQPISHTAVSISTEGAATTNIINTTGMTGTIMPMSQTVPAILSPSVDNLGIYDTVSLQGQDLHNQTQGQEPNLDPSLNFPFPLNDFNFGSAFPMADFVFGGMGTFAGGLMFDVGNGRGRDGGVGNAQTYEL